MPRYPLAASLLLKLYVLEKETYCRSASIKLYLFRVFGLFKKWMLGVPTTCIRHNILNLFEELKFQKVNIDVASPFSLKAFITNDLH